jgi:hypothetical protein
MTATKENQELQQGERRHRRTHVLENALDEEGTQPVRNHGQPARLSLAATHVVTWNAGGD